MEVCVARAIVTPTCSIAPAAVYAFPLLMVVDSKVLSMYRNRR